MKTKSILIFAVLCISTLALAQQCKNGPGLEPYCQLNNPPNQFHTTPLPPQPQTPQPNANELRDQIDRIQKQSHVEYCKISCRSDSSLTFSQRQACGNSCER
jgi:hypothetical protein